MKFRSNPYVLMTNSVCAYDKLSELHVFLLGKPFCCFSLNFLSDSKITKLKISEIFNIIQDGLFQSCSRMWGKRGQKKAPFPKICYTCPTVMKLGTVTSFLKKIQKTYESRGTPFEFCWHQNFFTVIQQLLLYQEIYI